MITRKKTLKLLLALTLGVSILPTIAAANSGGIADNPASGDYTGSTDNINITNTGGDVTIDTNVSGSVYGGYSSVASGLAATDNTVTITPTTSLTVDGAVYGGFSAGGNATNNTVIINDGTFAAEVVVGKASDDATDNILTINGGTFKEHVYNGWSGSNSSNNIATINGGTFEKNIYGGYGGGFNKNANNIVTINAGTTVKGNVYGGYDSSGSPQNNTVIINGGTFEKDIYGGFGFMNVHNNTVIINDGTFEKDIYGGVAGSGGANNNTVTINGGDFHNTSIQGSYSNNDTGNTLNWAHQDNVYSVANFNQYNFYVPAGVQPNDPTALLTITNGSATELNNATVKLVGIRGSKVWRGVNTVVLLENTAGINGFGGTVSGETTEGLKKYQYEIAQDSNKLVATVIGSGIGDQAKSLSEGRIAAIGFINTAADLATGTALNNAMASGASYDLFGAMSYSDSRYKSGSHADVKGNSFLLGFARNIDTTNSKWTLGVFLESGNSSYETFNNFADAGDVRAHGKNNYFGGGVMARNSQDSGMYYEGSIRLGRMSTDYNSSDIDTKYDIKSTYYGVHLGIGKVTKLNDSNDLDVYGKYYWSHQNAATASIDGDNFDFDSINSHRLRVGARLNMVGGGHGIKTYVGLAYEHEFSGSARATYSGESIAAPSVKGGTGIGEIGLVYKPSSKSAFSMDVGLNGYLGKRQGIGGGFKLNWGF